MPSSEQPLIYYSSLELENVRCFGERQTLELTDEKGRPAQWTLLLGNNGVGKTTLLQCLAWMRPVPAGAQNDYEPRAIEPALANEENRVFNSLLRSGDEVRLDLKATLRINQKLGQTKKGGPQKITTGISMLGREQQLESSELKSNEISHQFDNLTIHDFPIFAYGADRHMGASNLEKADLLDPLASLFSGSTELYDAEGILIRLDHRSRLDGRAKKRDVKRLRQVKQLLATILPDISDEKGIRILGPKGPGHPEKRSGVKFKTPYGLVPLAGLSLGYQTTLAWALDLASRLYEYYPGSANPLAKPAIVLIDEIDLHLHPLWQRKILEYLTQHFPQTQFIATTHSPLIVQAATNANFAVLQEQGGQITIENRPGFIESWRADQILTSDLFGVSARSPRIEALMDERNKLLDKLKRSASDKERLRELEGELDNLPTAERHEDQEAMDTIRQAAVLLKKQNPRQ